MDWPSGDQRGEPVMGPLKEVTFRKLVPSLLQIHISLEPERSLRKAMRRPSGEKSAAESRKLEAMSCAGAVRPSEDILHVLTLRTRSM